MISFTIAGNAKPTGKSQIEQLFQEVKNSSKNLKLDKR